MNLATSLLEPRRAPTPQPPQTQRDSCDAEYLNSWYAEENTLLARGPCADQVRTMDVKTIVERLDAAFQRDCVQAAKVTAVPGSVAGGAVGVKVSLVLGLKVAAAGGAVAGGVFGARAEGLELLEAPVVRLVLEKLRSESKFERDQELQVRLDTIVEKLQFMEDADRRAKVRAAQHVAQMAARSAP
jgi:outer membrane lipoprotein SlyB